MSLGLEYLRDFFIDLVNMWTIEIDREGHKIFAGIHASQLL